MLKNKTLNAPDSLKPGNSEGYPVVIGKSYFHWLGMSGVVLKPHHPSKHKQRAASKRK
jgi:hypothetical protein